MPTSPAPQHCPSPRELDDLELLSIGALAPLTGFDEPGSPVTLTLPEPVADQAAEAGAVELVDPEGLPLARVSVPGGEVDQLAHAQFGPFRDHYLSPTQVRERYAGRTFVPVTDALTREQLDSLASAGPLVLLALVGHGTPALSPVGLVRASLAAARHLPDAVVVAVPLASHGDPEVDHALGVQVVANYAGPDPVLALPSPAVEQEPMDEQKPVVGEAPVVELAESYHPDIAEIVAFERPAPDDQGLVLFFTGLSGSGKSTLARALMDRLLEQGNRTVTSLDGDVVRRHLSAGLTFSKEDRETNIRRIGWVAAEIARHGGVAVCSPIAPFDATRQDVRRMVEDAGGAFFLVHVATPLEECERRDRKGLYARARRGEIPEFTGISSPYEEPEDADVRVDTTGRTIDECLAEVAAALAEEGYVSLETATPLTGFRGSAADGLAPQPAAETPAVEVRAQRASKPRDPNNNDDAGLLRVLFVCTANICRSPYMEHRARDLAGPDATIEFASAGTHGFMDHAMDDVVARTLLDRGVDPGAFRSRPLTRDLVDEADLVLTAESTHRAFILDEQPAAFRKVFTLGQFAEAVKAADGDTHGRHLVATVGARRGAADPALDVADPYARGPEAAERAAAHIDELLRVVVPALTGSRRIDA